MYCYGVEGEELDEAETAEEDIVVQLIELDYKKDGTMDDDDEEDAARYTDHKRASLQLIAEANVGVPDDDNDNDDNVVCVVDDDDDNNINNNNNKNDNEEEEEKDEAFYQKEEPALKGATLLAKLRKHIEQARSMQKLAQKLVSLGKVCTMDNLPPSKM